MRLNLVLCLFSVVLCASADDTTTVDTTTTARTTPAPTTKTTARPVTTVPPKPTPPTKLPDPESYAVTEDNITCIAAKFAAQFIIQYTNTAKDVVNGTLNVVNGTVDSGSKCINGTELTLSLNFPSDNVNNLKLEFVEKDGEKYVDKVTLEYIPSSGNFPGHPDPDKKQTVQFVNLTLFEVKGEKSYLCDAEVKINQNDNTVAFGSAHIDSFRTEKNTGKEPVYRDAVDCKPKDDINDMVPIAVGIALLALVVIVLIAYFIGRRRSRRLAYQSV